MRYAWTTYVSSNEYLNGAIVLYKSLETKHDFVLMMPEDFVYGKGDIPAGIIIKRIKSIEKRGKLYARSNYKHAINKIYIWTLEEYDKVCWLDSDMLVIKNIDHIFNIDIPDGWIAAAPGCTCNYFRNPNLDTLPAKCPFKHKKAVYINAGLIIIRPNRNVYKRLLSEQYNYPLCEQDAFNIIFKDRIIVLDTKYNYLNHLALVHPVKTRGTDIHVIHFCYGKPWVANTLGKFQEYYDRWKTYSLNVK